MIWRMIWAAAVLISFTDRDLQAQQAALQEWAPAQPELAKLSDEVSCGGGSLRILKGMTGPVARTVGQQTRTAWGQSGVGILEVKQFTINPDRPNPEQVLTDYLEFFKTRSPKFENTAVEAGLLGGKPALRIRMRGEGLLGLPGDQFGFIYAFIGPERATLVTGVGPAATVDDVESAALTFRLAEAANLPEKNIP